MARFGLNEWQAEQLRLTLFPVPGAVERQARWWDALTGAPPEEVNTNPRRGTGMVSGSFGPGKLVLGLENERIDWLLVPRDLDVQDTDENEFPHTGSFPDVLATFSGLMERFLQLEGVPDVARLAFGAVLKHPEVDHAAGYARVSDYTPARVSPSWTDFLIQINTPIPSRIGIDGLQLNRLSKWSIALQRRITVLAIVGGAPQQTLGPPLISFRLELDINTAPTFDGPLPRTRVLDIYRELVSLGGDLATSGIPAP